MENKLLESALVFAEQFQIHTNSVKVEHNGTHLDCSFGSIENDGIKVSISVFNIDNSLDRIILSMGKNHAGKSIYAETRDEEIFDSFVNQTLEFNHWMQDSINRLEIKMN